MAKTKTPTTTVIVTKRQCMFGVTSGDTGVPAYEWKDGRETTNGLWGLPIERVIGEELGEGSKIRVTIEVMSRKRLRKNPWLKNR